MATRRVAGNLQSMYTTGAPRIRDRRAAYGPHEADGDAFPAARVLDDLAHAADDDVPRILARYAALRSRLLLDDGADPILVRHALDTARAYLAAVDGWPEAAALERLTDADLGLSAAWEAGTAADAAGHPEGAFALFRAGYVSARRGPEVRWAARFAAVITELLERNGMDGSALWARRATQLRRLADRG